MPFACWALILCVAAPQKAKPPRVPRAIEITFPTEIELPFARTSPLKATLLKARWADSPSGPELAAWVSFGEIRKWQRDADGGFSGEWQPPTPAHPGELQLVVSTRVDDRTLFSAQSTAVSAEIELRGRSEPDAEVEILLGGASFGPVRAQHDGRFALLVTVPPGAQTAIAKSRDRLGNVARKTVELFVPVVPRLALVCPIRRVQAAGAPVEVLVGNAREASGAVEEVRFIPPEVITEAQVTLSVKSQKLGVATCLVDVEPQRAARATALFEPPFMVADGKDKATLAVRVFDRFGNATSDAEVLAKEGTDARALSWNTTQQRFELALTSRRDVEDRRFELEVRALSRACRTSAVGAGGPRAERDYRQIPCVAQAQPTFTERATLQQIPDRGVRLFAAREGDDVVIRLSPASEASALQVSDEAGALGAITKRKDGAFSVPLAGLQGDILVTHVASGTSVLVKR